MTDNNRQLMNQLSQGYPLEKLQTFNKMGGNPGLLTFSNPFPEKRLNYQGILDTKGVDLNAPTPYLQAYNLTIERDLGASTAIEIGYSGSKGTHLSRQYNVNQPYYFAPELHSPSPGQNIPKPFPQWNTVQYYAFGSSSAFHSAQLTLRKRLARGIFYRANYTFGKSIDDASMAWENRPGGYQYAQDSRNLRLERGRSSFDSRHVLTFNFSYTVKSGIRWVKGWQVSGTGQAYSGKPFTPQLAVVNWNLGEANRPDRIGLGTLPDPGPGGWFDKTAFPVVPQGSYRPGNSGRNILDSPGFVGLNFSLMRNFKLNLSERDNLQFRVDVFNAPNRVNFLTPVADVDVPNGGTLTRARDGRSMQLGVRYQF